MDIKINNPAILNDLIEINNDRIKGYQKAAELAQEIGLDNLDDVFQMNMLQSKGFIAELTPHIGIESEENNKTGTCGKLFRLWMIHKVNISGNDKKSVLEACEKGEDAFKECYRKTLAEDDDQLAVTVRNLIRMQLNRQLEAYNVIKRMRESTL